MRIISGKWRGKVLASPEGLLTRPTSDRVRESLFNILAHNSFAGAHIIDGALVLDGFAGTGALGIEALSRGGQHAVFIETDENAARACQKNIKSLNEEKSVLFLKQDITALPERPSHILPRTLVFLDPPYGLGLGEKAMARLATKNWLAPGALIVLEMSKRETENTPAGFVTEDERSYGGTLIRFLRFG